MLFSSTSKASLTDRVKCKLLITDARLSPERLPTAFPAWLLTCPLKPLRDTRFHVRMRAFTLLAGPCTHPEILSCPLRSRIKCPALEPRPTSSTELPGALPVQGDFLLLWISRRFSIYPVYLAQSHTACCLVFVFIFTISQPSVMYILSWRKNFSWIHREHIHEPPFEKHTVLYCF